MASFTGLRERLDKHLGQTVPGGQTAAPIPGRVKDVAKRWARKRAAARIPEQGRRRRLRETARKLKEGLGAEIPLSDIRLSLFHMRDEDAFTSSTIARHRLVTEAMTRPGKTPVNVLFNAFFHIFERGSPETDRIYQHLRKNQASLRISSREFVEKTKFFDGDYGLDTIIDSVDLRNPVRSLARSGLKDDVQDSLYGLAIKCALIERTLAHVDLDAQPLKTILGWIELGERRRPDLECAYYEILLSPFVARDPSPDVKRTISRFLLGHFGDPRSVSWPKLRDDTGRLKRDASMSVMVRWLDTGILR